MLYLFRTDLTVYAVSTLMPLRPFGIDTMQHFEHLALRRFGIDRHCEPLRDRSGWDGSQPDVGFYATDNSNDPDHAIASTP